MHTRIKALADIFPRENILVDIGCDHGHLGLELLRTDKALGVINIDISKFAIAKCEENYKRYGWDTKSLFLHGDGFKGIKSLDENVVIVISGMGSYQILNILENIPKSVNHLILMSHTDYYPIRNWSVLCGWYIKNEKYVDDGKNIYLILDLIKTSKPVSLSFHERIFGCRSHWSYQLDTFAKYWKEKANRLLKIPCEYRSKEENYILDFLIQNEILKKKILY